MNASFPTKDYYLILEVEQNATPELIRKCYKRLALKLHPDRNAKNDTTKNFQLLQEAYVILNDERERRAYDIIYPSIPGTQRQTPTSTTQSGVFKEVAQIAVLQKSKRDRDARWEKTSNAFEARILDLMKDIRCLEQGINNLSSIFAAEAVAEAQKNSWTAWILSPISKQVQETEETRVYKDIKRQERRIEKDMKERHLASKKAVLTTEKSRSEKARDEFQATSRSDDSKIQAFRDSISARGIKEMRERERG